MKTALALQETSTPNDDASGPTRTSSLLQSRTIDGWRDQLEKRLEWRVHIKRLPSIENELKSPSNGDSDDIQEIIPEIPQTAKKIRDIAFRSLERWEGVVDELKGNEIFVRLYSDSIPNYHETAVLSTNDVDPDDRELLVPGGVFYWSIGYRDGPSGRETISVMRFRRLPAWDEKRLNKIRREADELFKHFGSA